MTITMNDNLLVTLTQLEAYTTAADLIVFHGARRTEKYVWIETLLSRFFYFQLRKRDKVTGYSDAQVTRLIRQKKTNRRIVARGSTTRSTFPTSYTHIPRQHANAINRFYQTYFNTYVNLHRPSGYATTIMTAKGKERKIYRLYETPYAHLKQLPGATTYLKPGVTFEQLDQAALATDDLTCATLMQAAKYNLFKSFRT